MPIQSTYAKNGIPYANAIFEGGHILYRNVDKNYDGLYELTEHYSFDTFNHADFIDKDESVLLYEELFGTIQYLISDASKFVTGTIAIVDGGFDAFSI
jgi:hypothetical protein